jgi:signal transduction histidine kinase
MSQDARLFIVTFSEVDDSRRLRALVESILVLEADVEVDKLLQHFVDHACSLTGARYGAATVLDGENAPIRNVYQYGMTTKLIEQIGEMPSGVGLLGLILKQGTPLRLKELRSHPLFSGFPPSHPQMRSFLGVPFVVDGQVLGGLYLADKVNAEEFSHEDEIIVLLLANWASLAIHNERLRARLQQSAIYEERDRIARDLHDSVIQRLFAIGLSLSSAVRSSTNEIIVDRIPLAVGEIDEVIRQIRTTIFGLSVLPDSPGVRAQILNAIEHLSPLINEPISITFDGAIDDLLTDSLASELIAVLGEAVSNAGRHGKATQVSILVSATPEHCRLVVNDNGKGMGSPSQNPGNGNGLVNIAKRAKGLGGHFEVIPRPKGGTSLTWTVPILKNC